MLSADPKNVGSLSRSSSSHWKLTAVLQGEKAWMRCGGWLGYFQHQIVAQLIRRFKISLRSNTRQANSANKLQSRGFKAATMTLVGSFAFVLKILLLQKIQAYKTLLLWLMKRSKSTQLDLSDKKLWIAWQGKTPKRKNSRKVGGRNAC